MERERRSKLRNEEHVSQKKVRQIHAAYERIHEAIGQVQEGTARELWRQRSEIWQTLDKKLEEIKQQLKTESEKKREGEYDFKEKEQELNEHLETMTQIAQKIDDENRDLMKKNSDLKIQYMSQENDRDLLLKQLIYQKKEHQRLKKEAEEKKQEADKYQKSEKDQEEGQNSAPKMPHVHNPTRIKSWAKPFAQGRQSQHNLSGINNNSRRNITLGSANIYGAGVVGGRPKTAAMPGGLPRPPTGFNKFHGANNMTASAGKGGMNFLGQRAASAQVMGNPRIKRYEDIIQRLKKMMAMEKKSLRMVRTLCSKEIEAKNQLEKILRQCVDDVKSEIARKRSENKSVYRKHTFSLVTLLDKARRSESGTAADERTLTQQEREKIIEVLLSQERVLTLLYDKTFPPRPSTAKVGVKNVLSMKGQQVFSDDNMRQFNYYGQIRED